MNEEFKRSFERTDKAINCLMIAASVVALVMIGVTVWAIVMLVNHFVG